MRISGGVYDFEVNTGKDSTKKDNEIEGILMGGNVVYRLTQTLPLNKNYKVFFDNFFSSIALLKLLKKEWLLAVPTLRKDRLKDAGKFLKNENEPKKVILDRLMLLIVIREYSRVPNSRRG